MVAEYGSFTHVADELDLTQPAVARQVRALETHFGATLVDVVGRRVVLTAAGRFLAQRIGSVLDAVTGLDEEMVEFAQARTGECRLGVTMTIGVYTLAPLLARFQEANPGVRLLLSVGNTAATVARLHAGRIGLALIEGETDDPRLDAVPYQEDRLVLVLPKAHRFAGRSEIEPRELLGERFIWRERGSGTRALAERALANVGVYLPASLELPSGEGVARAVESGIGLAILSFFVVERQVAEGRLAVADLSCVDLRRTFRIVRLKGRTVSPAARAFERVLLEASSK